MNKLFIFSLIISLFVCCKQKTIIDTYSAEISNLKTEEDIESYWKELHKLDQITYLKDTKNIVAGDSISITNMIRTALMFEIHGKEVYSPNNSVPILNLTHNYIGDSNLAFWPIIQECKKVGGIINTFGGKFPAYQLDGISLSFYDYSLFNQEPVYNKLLKKLNNRTYKKVSTSLLEIMEQQKQLLKLKEKELIGKWRRQHFKGRDNERIGFFELIEMSDNKIYIKRSERLIELNLVETKKDYKLYQIKNEPFGWYYLLKPKDELSLMNEKHQVLINYKR